MAPVLRTRSDPAKSTKCKYEHVNNLSIFFQFFIFLGFVIFIDFSIFIIKIACERLECAFILVHSALRFTSPL